MDSLRETGVWELPAEEAGNRNRLGYEAHERETRGGFENGNGNIAREGGIDADGNEAEVEVARVVRVVEM